MVYSLTWLAEVLEDAGLKVAEVPGWRSRGRSDIGEIKGVICHHTAGAGRARGVMPSLDTIVEGRAASKGAPALAGPLSQLALGRDGTFFVVAAGRANHAGTGEWKGITDGNGAFIGIEAENTGGADDLPWPEVQLDAYARGVAAILKRIDAPAEMCCGHKEYAPHRKDDPSFDMDAFRTRVDAILRGGAPVRPSIPVSDGSGRATLRRGARGELVEGIQRRLSISVDALFGPVTEAAVRAFQRSHELVPDGIVGPQTWAALLAD